jgi:hypothetical protein
MEPMPASTRPGSSSPGERRIRRRYACITTALLLPLLFTFASLRNIYPFAASTMMLGDRDLQSDREYFVLRGETIEGKIVDLPAIELTNALSGRNWSLVSAAVDNKSFKIRRPYPANAALAAAAGGVDKLPEAARLPDLLRAWGSIYNSRLPTSSPQRLQTVQLDAFEWRWRTGEADRLIKSWRVQL